MKFSLITPTNSTKYLIDLYQSILSQSYGDWEWVLYFNKVSQADIELTQTQMTDPRVRFIKGDSFTNIGEIKLNAFKYGEGDVLCEVDHDDILYPNCLEKLNEVYESDESVGFVYSDDSILDETRAMSFHPYSSKYGWKFEVVDFLGSLHYSMKSFDPSASSMSIIYYQPDHIRTWRKDVYYQIGGHNPKLDILDDQDLLSRTYLKTKCHHIKEPLYLYRYHENNSHKYKSGRIIELAPKIQFNYLEDLVFREYELINNPTLKMVDLGGGINGHRDMTTMDIHGGDIECDLNDEWKLEDNSTFYVHASHVFEHLRDPLHTMSELYRVLCDGGYAYIEVPSTDGRGAFQDPTHVSYWNSNSFWYYTRESHNKYIRHYGKEIKFKQLFLDNIDYGEGIICTRVWLQAIKSDAYRCGLCDIGN